MSIPHNQECPMCKEIGWGLVGSDKEELTIKMHCTMCDQKMTVNCHNDEDFHKTLVAVARREMRMGLVLLGQELMEMTGWDDCNTYANMRDIANKLIPEGC